MSKLRQLISKASFSSAVDRATVLECIDQMDATIALLRSDAERIASCPWRVQKGTTALCQPPKNFRALETRFTAALDYLHAPLARTAPRWAVELTAILTGCVIESDKTDCGHSKHDPCHNCEPLTYAEQQDLFLKTGRMP